MSPNRRPGPVRTRARRPGPARTGSPRLRPGAGRGDRGNTTIELVLFTPLLFFAIFATVQFGLTYLGNSAAQSAAREGARVARTGGTCDEAAARAQEILTTVGKGLFDAPPVVERNCGEEEVTVIVTVQGLSVVPGLPTIQIRQQVTGPVENFRADTL
jgi:hypothetical protein